ncbi:MAG: aminotransferase class I/II-fold pyridoxal phosphate-dependent enzyme [Bacillota bacterium]
MKNDQQQAPLLDALLKYIRLSRGRYHVPGHGGGSGVPEDLLRFWGSGVFSMDVTEVPGLDDLNSPTGVIARAQELASQAFGVNRSFFLANGTTLGLQSLILSAGQPGDRLVLPRNSHRSVIGGLIISGIDPVFVSPVIVPGFDFAAGVSVFSYKSAFEKHPRACAAMCVHPTYYGTVGNTAEISQLARFAGIPLLADEAHGCHNYFHRDYPKGALELGADAAVQSIHKTGGSLTQSSILHLGRNTLLEGDRVFSAIKLLQTSSPSYLLMASLDAARRQLALRGTEMLEEILKGAEVLRKNISGIRGLEMLEPRHIDGDDVFALDPSRVVIKVSGIGMTGYHAYSWLAEKYGIYAELADRNNIVFVLGPGTTIKGCKELSGAIKNMAEREGGPPLAKGSFSGIPKAKVIMSLRDAWFAPSRQVRIEDAAGKVSAEWVAVYPPGIPALIPGEEVCPSLVNYLIEARESGARFQGPADPELNFVRVIDV